MFFSVMSSLVDCLLLSERKHLQSNIKENNFSTRTLKTDIMDNSSDNSFNDRLKQQDLRVLGENAKEDQPATSLKCLEIPNAQKEDATDSLNSEIISNIKHSACLMARKRSRLLHKGCYLDKGKENKYESADVTDGATVSQSLKEQLAQSSPRDKECLIDVHRDTMCVTDGSFNNTFSQINFGITGVSSDFCNKIPTDKKHATDQWSLNDYSNVLGPLGVNCSENVNPGLKQGDKTDSAAFSEEVADNQEPESVENNESPQAASCNNAAVQIDKESFHCIGDGSLHELISEDDKQVPAMYSSTKSKENLKHKGKSSGNLNACSWNLGFGGFQTASNKQIKFSAIGIAKGRMLFKDIENEYFEASSIERVGNFSNQVKKENTSFSDSESKLGSNLSESLDSQTSFLEPRHTQFVPHKDGLCKSFPRSRQSWQETNQTLTASQAAEIAELSSILEETGSQFEFTQFRKQSNTIQSHVFQQLRTAETRGATNVENISETRKKDDFCSTFESENQVKNDRYCPKQEDINEYSKVVEYGKENAMGFHKNDKRVTFTNLDRNGSRISDGSFPVAEQDRFSNFVGFTSAAGKKINISKEALTRSAELFRDLDDDNYFLKSSETSTGCRNSNGHMSSNCDFVRCLTNENKGKMVCVSNFKSTDANFYAGSISHHEQKTKEENISTSFKEDKEKQTKLSVTGNENVNFSSTNTVTSCLSSIKKHNQNHNTSKEFLNQDSKVEGSFQEDSLDVTCLGDTVTSAEEHSLSDEMENLSPAQKGEDRKENECLSQKLQTPADGDIPVPDAALDHSLNLLNVRCGERDVNVSENSDRQKTNRKNVTGEDTTHDKNLLANESRIKIDSYHHHQIPFEQKVDVEKNEMKGSYVTGFHTASGKKITIADGFLAKAEQFFAENVDLGKEHNDNFENLIKKRKRENCVKDYDLCVESVECHPEKLSFIKKLDPEEPGYQFKQAVEISPIKHAVILDTVNLGEVCERGLVTTHKKADDRPAKSELESLPGQESDALSRTHLSEDDELFAERDMGYSPKKKEGSDNVHDFPECSAASLHLITVSDDLEGNSVPGEIKNTLFVEDRNNKSHQSLLTSESSCSCLNCDSKAFDLEQLNKPCADTNCFTDAIVNTRQNQALVSLHEDETNLTRLKETALNVENQKGHLKQTVFNTAKGKAVSVSESALARARQMFQDDYSESVKFEIDTNSRANQTEITGNLSPVICAECPNSAKFLNATGSEKINSAASHLKVNASASENVHQDTNTSADAESVSNSRRQCFEQNMEVLGHFVVPDKRTKQSGSSTSNPGFFSTASGKPVQLSEESLRKARQLFCEMEGEHSSRLQEACLGEKDVEKSEMQTMTTTTEVVPRKMWIVLPKSKENASTELISDPAFGFSTASGKQVTVSKNAYQKAKEILNKSDDFLRGGLYVTDQRSSVEESGQHVKSLADKVISECKIEKSCSEDCDLKRIYPEEFPSTHHDKMPEYVPQNKKNKQLTSFKNSSKQEETRSFRKGQLNLGVKAEPEAISCSAKAEVNISIHQTPKNYLEVEAVESTRAFMEDDLSDSGVQINAAQSFSGRLDKSFQNKTCGKRRIEEENSLGRSLSCICSTPYFCMVGSLRLFLMSH